jgi:hypothetical protein
MKKITTGYVIQDFNKDGECLSQVFIAGDQVEWEDDRGNFIAPQDFYYPFQMMM